MANGNYTVVVDGQRFNVSVFEGDVQNIQVAAPVQNIAPVEQVAQQTQAQTTYSGNEVKAPVNGNVWKLLVKEGDKVEKDQQLIILEAMKMEIDVVATVSGTVTKILTDVNKSVEEGQTLILIS
ncbi:biotin/lipoyl-containing protein [Arcobacter porcinus]|uniref:Biotin attachment protein n=1 Tax=Arcobacter porcinus TaxID=1935204 RepID=A0A5C2HAM0_9BACT|nr:biotin/lipoyl-containing protein [Arcobacter porcinus]OCL97161.1 Methylmalonyl-CoA carboxyltransferase 1.3S subunit [Aliarcobacter thereius]QEP39839.1 biotin attachment protein [Arcobacter porcinus]